MIINFILRIVAHIYVTFLFHSINQALFGFIPLNIDLLYFWKGASNKYDAPAFMKFYYHYHAVFGFGKLASEFWQTSRHPPLQEEVQ